MNRSRLCIFILTCCCIISGCFQKQIIAEIATARGLVFKVRADFYDDGIGIPLDFQVIDSGGTLRDGGGILVVDSSRLAKLSFSVYEADDGKIIGLYENEKPDIILAIVDISNEIVFPSGKEIEPPDFFRMRDEALQRLRSKVGRDLTILR